MKVILLLLASFSTYLVKGQDEVSYLKTNAVHINDPEKLNDSVYRMLSGFRLIMVGEMHGTNESAPFVNGLANLFTNNDDSVLVGLELPPDQITKFIAERSDSSIYKSDFFSKLSFQSGRESVAWASLISKLNRNPRVQIFFFDMNTNECKLYRRDSLMAAKIKAQIKKYSHKKTVTLSGNYHNRTTEENTMAYMLMHDKELSIGANICSLNMEYAQGTCNANFGHGLEVKQLGSYPSVYNSTTGYDRYIILMPPKSKYQYTGQYFTRFITAAKMTIEK